jgi:putative membrane protein
MIRLLAVASFATVLAIPVMAGGTSDPIGNATFATPGAPSKHDMNTSDRVFLLAAATSGSAGVKLGRLATETARNEAVKGFGRQMAEDHSKANERLNVIADKLGIAPPKDLDPEHKALRAQLEKLAGAEFDFAYLNAQLADHQKTAQLFEYEIAAGQNEDLKRFAAMSLPVILGHLETVVEIRAKLFGIKVSSASQ